MMAETGRAQTNNRGRVKTMIEPCVMSTETERLSPWVTLTTRSVAWPGEAAEKYHCFQQSDYVNVLAITASGEIPLVRQFRPALARVTLELPAGIIDQAETPAAVAERELFEETGFRVCGSVIPLGTLRPDTGRLQNQSWCFFAHAERVSDWTPEPRVERVIHTRQSLRSAILDGTFDHALHIAVINLALLRGCFCWH
jgi:ADP-ribose pyrophosphatase